MEWKSRDLNYKHKLMWIISTLKGIFRTFHLFHSLCVCYTFKTSLFFVFCFVNKKGNINEFYETTWDFDKTVKDVAWCVKNDIVTNYTQS